MISTVQSGHLFCSETWGQIGKALHPKNCLCSLNGLHVTLAHQNDLASTSYQRAIVPLFDMRPEQENNHAVGYFFAANCFPEFKDQNLSVFLDKMIACAGRPLDLIIPFVPEAALESIEAMAHLRKAVPALSSFSLKVRWKNLEGYLVDLKPKARQSARREIRRFFSNGYFCDVTTDMQAIRTIEVLSTVQEFSFREPLLNLILNAKELELIAFSALDSDGVRATCIGIVYGSELYLRNFLVRPDARYDNMSYFKCCYYEPITYAIHNGLELIHFGIGACEAKRYRELLETKQCTVHLTELTIDT